MSQVCQDTYITTSQHLQHPMYTLFTSKSFHLVRTSCSLPLTPSYVKQINSERQICRVIVRYSLNRPCPTFQFYPDSRCWVRRRVQRVRGSSFDATQFSRTPPKIVFRTRRLNTSRACISYSSIAQS